MEFKIKNVSILIPKFGNLCYKTIAAVAEGLLQSEYAFEKYLTKRRLYLH